MLHWGVGLRLALQGDQGEHGDEEEGKRLRGSRCPSVRGIGGGRRPSRRAAPASGVLIVPGKPRTTSDRPNAQRTGSCSP